MGPFTLKILSKFKKNIRLLPLLLINIHLLTTFSWFNNLYPTTKQERIPIKKPVKMSNLKRRNTQRKMTKTAKILWNMNKLFSKKQIKRFNH